MKFDDKEMQLMIARKIDNIVFQSKGQNVFVVNINDLITKKIESDENLKKQLLTQVLQSEN